MQESGRWQLQLHSGKGDRQIKYGADLNDIGPYYAYKEEGEAFWQCRSGRARTSSGVRRLSPTTCPRFDRYAFAPPYGEYGQHGTNDPRIPDDLLGWLTQRYTVIFTQDGNFFARVGSGPVLGRLEVTRVVSGSDLHAGSSAGSEQ